MNSFMTDINCSNVSNKKGNQIVHSMINNVNTHNNGYSIYNINGRCLRNTYSLAGPR